MNGETASPDLLHSCRILFGPHVLLTEDFLRYLQVSGVKAAFRRQAMAMHPDRLAARGPGPNLHSEGAEGFHTVREAYDTLIGFLARRNPPHAETPKAEPAFFCRRQTARHREQASEASTGSISINPIILQHSTETMGKAGSTSQYFAGEIPARPLLFGHFLYYSGLANWKTIARILAWQRMERPRIGEIGKECGMLKEEDIRFVLQKRRPFTPFGKTAERLGLLDDRQVRFLVLRQLRLQKRFGRILVEKQLLREHEVQELLFRFRRHNDSVMALCP